MLLVGAAIAAVGVPLALAFLPRRSAKTATPVLQGATPVPEQKEESAHELVA